MLLKGQKKELKKVTKKKKRKKQNWKKNWGYPVFFTSPETV